MFAKKLAVSLLFGAFAAGAAAQADAQVKIGVVSSSTGPIALVGIPQKNSVPLLPTSVGGQTVQYITLDDGSDPTATVAAFKKLITEEKVDAIIGPSGSPNAMGVIQFAAEAGVPMLAPVGTAAVVLPMTEQKKWVFKTTQNDDLIAEALLEHMAKTGIKSVGFIGTADPYGDNWLKVFGAGAAKRGIKLLASERFQRQDTSLTAQGLKILSASPDAVLIAAPGSSSVLPQTTLYDQGYRGKLYQTHGAALPDFLKLGGKKVEGTILAASLMLVLDQVPDSHPSKKIAGDYVAAYEKLNGSKPATFGANVYDAGLLLERAIPVALKGGEPGSAGFRSALRDALEQVKELPATQGVYTLTPADHSGFDERGRELITVSGGKWTLVK
ncbi:branched-chain amino acid ABC transporter substrate-binding protein [Azospirillum thiophilum]|uniref:Branched-chain amino acid ABC transporter substrate-binding protein n=1 Tax=Azospirillum thiophilum TaxID=528244 RepID=A0AAC8ZWJ3_9PROT|nr:ABC transporter substrate-binding protein [Azospirillum thiophilum]ALG75218.1 branched-chain amino acid ABC transporter substrate-binding protein [Azospirillum thiophilum]KJR62614.1 branched-chain amino acid ABC transporter substrate-binding protein [Azospirillum thiophilum]